MDRQHWEAINEIFHAALERPPGERNDFVRLASKGDSQVESDVHRLLEADQRAGDFLETPLVAGDSGASDPASAPPLLPGDVLKNRYRIVRLVDEGGMGYVFEAVDTELHVRVALKLIRNEIAGNPAALELFRREVLTARAITHQHVCRTYDIDHGWVTRDAEKLFEVYFLTMEFLDGETLAARLKRAGRIELSESVSIAGQIASGLDAAHTMGIVHRDIKPSNIMLVDSRRGTGLAARVVITDFGLARFDSSPASGPISFSGLGHPAGTLAYMAPEQLQPGGPVSPATDVYALGLVLYEMVTGSRAFSSFPTPRETIQRLAGPEPSPQALVPDLPQVWEFVIRRCLQCDPAERFQSVNDVISALHGDGHPVDLPALPSADQPRRLSLGLLKGRKRITNLTAIVVAGLALIVVGLRLYRSDRDSRVLPGALVYLAPAQNQTGEKAFDNITELIQVELNQSSQVTVLEQSRVGDILQQMAKSPDIAIDQSTGREIAMRAGAVRVIFVTITGSGGNFTLDVDVQQPDNRPSRFRDHWTRSFDWRSSPSADASVTIPSALLSAVRTAGNWIRMKVGESKNDIARLDVPPDFATTSSWEALNDYAQATKLTLVGRRQDAITALDRAVRIDPEFALAFATRGDLLFSLHRQEEGRESYRTALETGVHDRLTRREEDRIRGMRAADSWDYEIAVDVFHDLTLNYPHDLEGWVYPVIALRMLNRNDEAIADLHQAIALAPDAGFAPYSLGQEFLIEGRTQEVPAWVDYLRKHNHLENAAELDAAMLFVMHSYEGARRDLESIGTSPNPLRRSYSFRDIARLDAERGNYEGALAELDKGLAADKESGDEEQSAAKMLAEAYLFCRIGQFDRCLQEEHDGLQLSPTLEHALAADAVLDQTISMSPPSALRGIRRELKEILRQVQTKDFARLSEQVKLRTRGELELADGQLREALRTLMTAAAKDAPAGSRDYVAHALLAVSAHEHDQAEVRLLLRKAQAALAIVSLHPAMVLCDAGSSLPGSYGDQLEAYLHVSRLLGDRSDTVQRAEQELLSLRPGQSNNLIH